jgi:hypothetical protein
MKFVCLGYAAEWQFDASCQDQCAALLEEGFAYDDELRRGGHIIGGEALQSFRNAVTLRYRNGELVVTDGPYAETKEQLGGILVLEARDLNHAIQLMSKHPGARSGAFEIRPANEEINALFEARQARAGIGQ